MANHLVPGSVPAEGVGNHAADYEANRTLPVRATSTGAGSGNGTSMPALAPPHPACEEEYQKIGWWKGAYATPEAREQVRAFWRRLGEPGVLWLARRVGHEDHVDILDGVANLLADLGPVSIRAILEVLGESVSVDQTICLLSALRWLGHVDQSHQAEAHVDKWALRLSRASAFQEDCQRAARPCSA